MELSINGAKILATFENVPVFGTLNITQTLIISWVVMLIITGLCIWLVILCVPIGKWMLRIVRAVCKAYGKIVFRRRSAT